jgi:AcrR family transcriptional regulator
MATPVEQTAEIERLARRRKNDPEGVRARILDAAFELFQSKGYNAASVHDIAASAGVTGGALHHHFPTKKVLALHVIAERVATALEETWLEPIRNSADARAGILKVFGSLARELDAQGSVRGCPVNNLTLELAFADPDYRNALRTLFDQWRETLAKKLGGRDSIARAALIIAAYSGAMAMAKVEQNGEPLRLCAKELKRIL